MIRKTYWWMILATILHFYKSWCRVSKFLSIQCIRLPYSCLILYTFSGSLSDIAISIHDTIIVPNSTYRLFMNLDKF